MAVKTLTDWESAFAGASGSLSFDAPFDQPFYMLLNLAVDSGQFSQANKAEFKDKIDMYVDYVRVFQREDGYSEDISKTVPEKEHTALADGNLIYNGKFDQGKSRLGYWSATDGTIVSVPRYTVEKLADGDLSVADIASKANYENITDGMKYYERRVQISAGEDAEPTVYQPGLKLQADSYQLGFDIYSKQDVTVTAAICREKQDGAKTVPGEVLESVDIPYKAADGVKRLDWQFETKEALADAVLVFRFAKGASVQMDNVVLTGSIYGEMPLTADSGWTANNDSGTVLTLDSKDGAHTLRNVASGQNWYSPQVVSSDFALVKGKKYKLSMKCKLEGASNNTFEYIIQENGGGWTVFWDQTKLAYDSKKADADGFCSYEVIFTAAESLPNVHVVFGLGNSAATGSSSFCIKDVTMGAVYGISYKLDGGSNAACNPKEYGRGEKNVSLAAPVKTGYDFLGWTVGETGTDYIDTLPTGKGGNIVLYANWAKSSEVPSDAPAPTDTPKPSNTPKPSDTPKPESTPEPAAPDNSQGSGGGGSWTIIRPIVLPTPKPGGTPRPEGTSEPVDTQSPDGTPDSANTAAPTGTPDSVSTAAPTATPEPDKKKISAKKVTLHAKKVFLVKGKKCKLKAVMSPENTTDKITWSSSKKSVAVVKNGMVTAKGVGTANITAKTTSGKKAVCMVSVVKKTKKAYSISLNKKSVILDSGERILLRPTLKPAKSTDTVKWKSSDTQVASVDAYGFVTAKGRGKATITAATSAGKKAKCVVTVDDNGLMDDMISFIYDIITGAWL